MIYYIDNYNTTRRFNMSHFNMIFKDSGKSYNVSVGYSGNALIICDNNAPRGSVCKHYYKVVDDPEFVYKILKTRIKAKGGAAGLYAFMEKNAAEHFGEAWNRTIIINALRMMKEVGA